MYCYTFMLDKISRRAGDNAQDMTDLAEGGHDRM
jgi:hypothetical protein